MPPEMVPNDDTKAVAPAAFSGLLAIGLTRNAALGALVAVGFAGLGSFWVSTRPRDAADR